MVESSTKGVGRDTGVGEGRIYPSSPIRYFLTALSDSSGAVARFAFEHELLAAAVARAGLNGSSAAILDDAGASRAARIGAVADGTALDDLVFVAHLIDILVDALHDGGIAFDLSLFLSASGGSSNSEGSQGQAGKNQLFHGLKFTPNDLSKR